MSDPTQASGVLPADPKLEVQTESSTFFSLWERSRCEHSDRPFLIFRDVHGEESSWTYKEFGVVVEGLASDLVSAGVSSGRGIHLCLKNCPAFVALWLAAARIGAWIVPVDPSSSAREIAEQLGRTSPKLGIYGTERADSYLAASEQFDGKLWGFNEKADDLLPYMSVSGREPAARYLASPSEEDRLAVMFTSGTTSQPKGVVLTQRNYFCVAASMAKAAKLGPEHRWFVTLPLFHGNAQYYCFASAIAVGASVALMSGFSASRWVADAISTGSTHASLFAAPIRMILARTPENQPGATLEHVWFAQNLGAEHHREFAELVGVAPRQLYGMTESVPIVTYDRSPEATHDVIGHPLEGRTVRLVRDSSLDPVPRGETGMIAVAGRRGVDLFAEYLDAPEITARTLVTDEQGVDWLLTGDLAVHADDRGLQFIGRSDDVIKVSGENVSLTEVEAALAQAPGVLEAAVLAEKDPIRDKVPVAYVVPKDRGNPPDITSLGDWATANLTKAARPRSWHVIEELPRTSVGKVRRFKLDNSTNGGQ